jgi:hypothetical protein
LLLVLWLVAARGGGRRVHRAGAEGLVHQAVEGAAGVLWWLGRAGGDAKALQQGVQQRVRNQGCGG